VRVIERVEEYRRWHWLQRETQDIDPVYPVLRHFMVHGEVDNDARAWLIFLHVAYYHLGSAAVAWDLTERSPEKIMGASIFGLRPLPCATERRGHRDRAAMSAHFRSLLDTIDHYGGPYALLCAPSWAELTERVMSVHGNGRWAAYKTCELAQKVLGIAIVPPDAAHESSTGPRQGLSDVLGPQPGGNLRAVIGELNRRTARLAARIGETDLGYVETSLCDYHSLINGRYYLGHDIDQMLEQLYVNNVGQLATIMELLQSRLEVLPVTYLGEMTGRMGPDKDRKHVYARTGQILERS
jgi:hypothetical protein